ncbi:hypothetical protein ACH5RR_023626, partial [Cinchona calisaya]
SKQKLLLSPNDVARAGTRYNAPLINSLVLYIGMQAMQQLQARTPPHAQSMASSVPLAVFLAGAALDIFHTSILDLHTEGRYLLLNAEMIQEQITRVLLERLIINRPHPWGLLITVIELIKNQGATSGAVLSQDVHQRLRNSLNPSQDPMVVQKLDESVVSGGTPDKCINLWELTNAIEHSCSYLGVWPF